MKKWIKCFLLIAGAGVSLWMLFAHFEGEKQVILRVADSVPGSTLTLPLKDKRRLDYLFRELIFCDDLGYTLLGSKPISFGGYLKPFGSFNPIFLYQSLLPGNYKMYLAWKTWSKYQHFFASSKHVLWAEKSPWIENGELIILANKKNISHLVDQYKEDFQQILGEELNLERWFQEVGHKPLFIEILHRHEGLIGSLLGYGRENAWLFWKRAQGEDITISGVWERELQDHGLAQLTLWDYLFHNAKEKLFYPPFVGDPFSQETQQLKNEYQLTRNKIIQYYEGKDFLEATLQLLKNGPSSEMAYSSHL